MNFLVNLNLNRNELQNAVIQPLATAPGNAVQGQIYYNTVDKVLYQYDGTQWKQIGTTYVLPIATSSTLGGVIVSTGLSVDGSGNTTVDYGSTSPAMDGTASAGSANSASRSDHVHPTDTSRAPTDHASSATTYGTGTGTNYGHLKLSDSTTSTSSTNGGIAATPAAVKAAKDAIPAAYTSTPAMDGVGSAGSSTAYAKGDHVHPSDTSKLSLSGGTMTGDIAMGGNSVTGLGTATADGDAVSLAQMNEAISTNTAFFRGSFATYAALMAVAWQTTNPSAANYVSNNDYAYVADDETHSDEAWRYIYVNEPGGQDNGWQAQFRVNEAPLTQAQIDALNSGANTTNIGQIATNTTAISQTRAMIAGTESSSTASQGYTAGDYFIYNNNLYRATATISQGGTITPNTNCVSVQLGSELETKAPLASPAFTGTPTAPTATSTTNNTQIATTAFVQTAVTSLVNTATGTIATTGTSATVSYTGTLVSAYATMGGSIVQVDMAVGASSVTFSTANKPSSAVTCTVVYA